MLFPTLDLIALACFAGGWAGYVPMAEDYPLGGYEVEVSPFAPEAARIVVEGAGELLQSMKAKG